MGGDSGRFVFTAAKGKRLGRLADALARACGGSLLVTDSPRTPLGAADALQAQLSVPNYCYRWHSGGTNPYRGLLALADAFVVTGESMSMLGEAAAMGRPLFIFDLGDDQPWWRLAHSYRYKPLSHRLAMRLGPRRMRREVGNIQSAVVDSGLARWLDQPGIESAAADIHEPGSDSPAQGSLAALELERTAATVRRLLPVH